MAWCLVKHRDNFTFTLYRLWMFSLCNFLHPPATCLHYRYKLQENRTCSAFHQCIRNWSHDDRRNSFPSAKCFLPLLCDERVSLYARVQGSHVDMDGEGHWHWSMSLDAHAGKWSCMSWARLVTLRELCDLSHDCERDELATAKWNKFYLEGYQICVSSWVQTAMYEVSGVLFSVQGAFLTEHHAIKAYCGSGGMAQRILDLGTRWGWVVRFISRQFYLQRKSPSNSLDRRLGGPQSWSGCGGEEKNSQLPPELEPPIIQAVAQRCATELLSWLLFHFRYYIKVGQDNFLCSPFVVNHSIISFLLNNHYTWSMIV
jgi:hypothetical protein